MRVRRGEFHNPQVLQQREQESLELTTALGGFKFKGDQMLQTIVYLMVAAFLGFLIYQHNTNAVESFKQVQGAQLEVVKSQDAVLASLKESRETTEALVYVITLPQGEREQLKLQRPRKLSDMQR